MCIPHAKTPLTPSRCRLIGSPSPSESGAGGEGATEDEQLSVGEAYAGPQRQAVGNMLGDRGREKSPKAVASLPAVCDSLFRSSAFLLRSSPAATHDSGLSPPPLTGSNEGRRVMNEEMRSTAVALPSCIEHPKDPPLQFAIRNPQSAFRSPAPAPPLYISRNPVRSPQYSDSDWRAEKPRKPRKIPTTAAQIGGR
jgi:hypothetical protein